MTGFRKKIYTNLDVVTAARERIKNIFANDCEIVFSVSGGKDSLTVHHLLYTLAASGQIDKSKLRVVFVDEEAVYPCIEETVRNMRKQWLLLGVPFDWYCMEFKHFNCLNQLSQDESFITFDRLKSADWVRRPPEFAIRQHPLLRPGKDTYQDFLKRLNKNRIQITGVRAAESVQRAQNLANGSIETTGMAYPIYDWSDKDVWKYLHDNGVEIPRAYLYMYQCGIPLHRLRISQFFSVDTVGSLVKMCEFYPDLFNKICKREPNAYMAMLYYDTELFRRRKQRNSATEKDYKAEVYHLLAHPELITVSGKAKLIRSIKTEIIKYGQFFTPSNWRDAYQILIAGDPKARSLRALSVRLTQNRGAAK